MKMLFCIISCLFVFCFFQIDTSIYDQLDEAKNERIRIEILRKLDEVKEKKLKECNKEALALAEVAVDSLVANIFSPSTQDTSQIPQRPIRPENDQLDSQRLERTTIKPFFESIDTTSNE